MKTYRVGIIGFGFIGKTHAYCYRNMPLFYDNPPFRAEIARVCTSRADTAQKAAEMLGGGVIPCTDYRAVTENPDIDIADISAPNSCHKEILLSAMKNGKHIYCEKPMTVSAEEQEEIRAALSGYSGIAQMTLQYRFLPAVIRAKQLTDSGALGDIHEFRADFLHAGSSKPETVISPWKLQAGVLADLGSHVLDLMDYLLGGTLSEICASCHTAYPVRPDGKGGTANVPTEDNMLALVRMKNHGCGVITATKLAAGAEDELRFEINGSKGALKFNGMNPNQLFYYDNTASDRPYGGLKGWLAIDCGQRYEKPAGFPSVKSPLGWLRAHQHCVYVFMDHVYHGTPCRPNLEDGIRLEKIMAAAKKSAAEGKWISF